MGAITDSIFFVGIAIIFAVCGVLVVRRWFKFTEFEQHHEVAGYLLAVVGTLYAVLLGMLVVNEIGKFDQARNMAEVEANCCSDIFQLTRALPLDARRSIRAPLVYYYKLVHDEDWEAMHAGQAEASTNAYLHIWKHLADYQPQGSRESATYSALLTTMNQFSDARRFRVYSAKRTVSPIIWIVLLTGGVMVVVFTYFFNVTKASTQIVLTSFVAVFISLNLLLVKLFDNPYRNDFEIKKQSFTLAPEQLGEMNKFVQRTDTNFQRPPEEPENKPAEPNNQPAETNTTPQQ